MEGRLARAHAARGTPTGEVIAASEGYKTKASAENGIKPVQTNAPGATVVDKTTADKSG